MHRARITAFAAAAVLLVMQAGPARAQDESRRVEGGGIHVQGWQGRVDANEAAAGMTLQHARFAQDGQALHVTTGPAVVYWNPANTASGNYTVKATFREARFMELNNHPHPYGIVIGGSDMGTDGQTYLYCAAYGNGTFILRGFGPEPFRVNGNRPEANDAINKAAARGEPVTQEIAVTVQGDKVECAINGKVVGSYAKSDIVAQGKLKASNGVYGVRFGHNTEALVTGLTVTRH